MCLRLRLLSPASARGGGRRCAASSAGRQVNGAEQAEHAGPARLSGIRLVPWPRSCPPRRRLCSRRWGGHRPQAAPANPRPAAQGHAGTALRGGLAHCGLGPAQPPSPDCSRDMSQGSELFGLERNPVTAWGNRQGALPGVSLHPQLPSSTAADQKLFSSFAVLTPSFPPPDLWQKLPGRWAARAPRDHCWDTSKEDRRPACLVGNFQDSPMVPATLCLLGVLLERQEAGPSALPSSGGSLSTPPHPAHLPAGRPQVRWPSRQTSKERPPSLQGGHAAARGGRHLLSPPRGSFLSGSG